MAKTAEEISVAELLDQVYNVMESQGNDKVLIYLAFPDGGTRALIIHDVTDRMDGEGLELSGLLSDTSPLLN